VKYQRQTQLQLNKTKDATPEEQAEWIEKELLPLGKIQLKFIAFMSILQIVSVGMMLLAFWIIGKSI
tara:strand:- start:699 stop:899 length:201 start_codon:yes stop_codon:yes gene_type:complete